jgi:hypothetical protein
MKFTNFVPLIVAASFEGIFAELRSWRSEYINCIRTRASLAAVKGLLRALNKSIDQLAHKDGQVFFLERVDDLQRASVDTLGALTS